MAIKASELLELARQVEYRIADLYQDIAGKFGEESEVAAFFKDMAGQEHIHAAWVDEMLAQADPEYLFEALEQSNFNRILTTIDDVHDEVVTDDIQLADALEILVHMEESTAEEFYLKFPKGIPGLPDSMVRRMVVSCEKHARAVDDFSKQCNAQS
ncbi:MAG: ferritin family protein [Planctomycetota bacterium]|jgi:rubrerythrin